MLLVPICFLSGQLIRFSYIEIALPMWLKIVLNFGFTIAAIILFIPLNTAPVILVMIDWINHSVTVFNVTFLFNVEMMNNITNKIPPIVLRDVHSLDDIHVIDNMSELEIFAKLVILFFAVSSCLSFIMFITALVCTYQCGGVLHRCMYGRDRAEPLNPFYINNKQQQQQQQECSTTLQLPESLYFILLLVLNIGIWATCICVFAVEHYGKPLYYPSNLNITAEAIGFSVYMYSLFCTIASCFIFSKLAYSVTHRCLKLEDSLNNHEVNTPNGLNALMDEDDVFTNMAKATLNWFEYWFTVHWILYTITSFLSIALFLEILMMHLKSSEPKPPTSAVGYSDVELWVIALFTISHCFMFLYPCFKAAAVTVSRDKLIKKINEKRNLDDDRKQVLIQYLRNKKYGFRISFFCARLRFSFNIAYVSIFIGLLGVLLKVTGAF